MAVIFCNTKDIVSTPSRPAINVPEECAVSLTKSHVAIDYTARRTYGWKQGTECGPVVRAARLGLHTSRVGEPGFNSGGWHTANQDVHASVIGKLVSALLHGRVSVRQCDGRCEAYAVGCVCVCVNYRTLISSS